MQYRWDIINHLIKVNNYKSYLEIGYYKGWSFDQVNSQIEKYAVDPNPSKSVEMEKAPYGITIGHSDSDRIYKVTSDDYFKEFAFILGQERKFDIIFIDGLHEASQVTKDIENSLKHLSEGGIIVMHDCNPPKYEHTTTGIDGCWTGDTYKAFIEARMKYPYEMYVINADWGCGIINPSVPGHKLNWPEDEEVTWDDFDDNRYDFLQLISVEEFLKKTNERTKNNQCTAQ